MASNVIGIINLFISILFKDNTCSRMNFHQIIIKRRMLIDAATKAFSLSKSLV